MAEILEKEIAHISWPPVASYPSGLPTITTLREGLRLSGCYRTQQGTFQQLGNQEMSWVKTPHVCGKPQTRTDLLL